MRWNKLTLTFLGVNQALKYTLLEKLLGPKDSELRFPLWPLIFYSGRRRRFEDKAPVSFLFIFFFMVSRLSAHAFLCKINMSLVLNSAPLIIINIILNSSTNTQINAPPTRLTTL